MVAREWKMAEKKKTTAKVASVKAKSAKPAAKPVAAKKPAVAAQKKPVVTKATTEKAKAAPVKATAPKAAAPAKPVAPQKAAQPKAQPVAAAKPAPAKVAAPKVAVPAKPAPKPVAEAPKVAVAPANPAVPSPKAAVAKPAVPPVATPPAHVAAAAAPAAPQQPAPRTIAQTVAKPMAMKGAAPAPATPKDVAQRAAASAAATTAAAAASAAKKPVSSRHGFKTNEYIVYPAHGVGRIVGIEEQEIAGMSLELFVITFDKDKLTLRVPTGKLQSVGMRKLAEEPVVKKAMETLKGRARIKRTMWSRRAQEYEAKINSGDLVSIAEVVRDLYRSEAQPEQSYSERQLYEAALDRMAREIAAVDRLDERGAVQRITEVLARSAKGRRAAAEGAEVVEDAEPEAETAEIKAA